MRKRNIFIFSVEEDILNRVSDIMSVDEFFEDILNTEDDFNLLMNLYQDYLYLTEEQVNRIKVLETSLSCYLEENHNRYTNRRVLFIKRLKTAIVIGVDDEIY